jgi:hypothetical protein
LLELSIAIFIAPWVESTLLTWIQSLFSEQSNKGDKINHLDDSSKPENLDHNSDFVSSKIKESKSNVDTINYFEDSSTPEKLFPGLECVSVTTEESKPKATFVRVANFLIEALLGLLRTSIRFFLVKLLLNKPLW